MVNIKRKKCRNCRKLFLPDPRNRDRQKYCRKPDCRRASKADSQKRWRQKPENQDYFRGPDCVERVQQWRKANPGYSRKKPRNKKNALQDPLTSQVTENNKDFINIANDTLQDPLIMQPTVLLGLIANFIGSALQDDIELTITRLQQLGLDIVNNSNPNKGGHYGIQVAHLTQSYPESAKAVQLDRPSSGP
jgi:hypothetical protein